MSWAGESVRGAVLARFNDRPIYGASGASVCVVILIVDEVVILGLTVALGAVSRAFLRPFATTHIQAIFKPVDHVSIL